MIKGWGGLWMKNPKWFWTNKKKCFWIYLGLMKLGRLKYKQIQLTVSHQTFRGSDYCWKVEKVVGTIHWSNSSWSWYSTKYINLLFSLNREELPQYWKNYVILLIYMKSDKTNYQIPRHITVINFKQNCTLHSSLKANYTCKQNWTNCGTFP